MKLLINFIVFCTIASLANCFHLPSEDDPNNYFPLDFSFTLQMSQKLNGSTFAQVNSPGPLGGTNQAEDLFSGEDAYKYFLNVGTSEFQIVKNEAFAWALKRFGFVVNSSRPGSSTLDPIESARYNLPFDVLNVTVTTLTGPKNVKVLYRPFVAIQPFKIIAQRGYNIELGFCPLVQTNVSLITHQFINLDGYVGGEIYSNIDPSLGEIREPGGLFEYGYLWVRGNPESFLCQYVNKKYKIRYLYPFVFRTFLKPVPPPSVSLETQTSTLVQVSIDDGLTWTGNLNFGYVRKFDITNTGRYLLEWNAVGTLFNRAPPAFRG